MLAELSRALPPQAVVVEEAVTNRPEVARQVPREPGQLFDTGAPGLGWALGGRWGLIGPGRRRQWCVMFLERSRLVERHRGQLATQRRDKMAGW
jgi:hypothetical protein